MSTQRELRSLIRDHRNQMADLPHPSKSHAKRGRTLLGYANYHRGTKPGPYLRTATSVIRATLGLDLPPVGRPPSGQRDLVHYVQLDARLRPAVRQAALARGSTLAATTDAVLWMSELVRAEPGYSIGERWQVRVSAEVHESFAQAKAGGRDMSWSLAAALGVELSG